MPATEYNAIVERGDTYDLQLTYLDVNRDPVDMTGWSFSWVFTVGEVTVTRTLGNGVEVNTTTAVITLKITNTQTASFVVSRGTHRLRVTTPAGVYTLLAGGVIMKNSEVTNG